MAESVTVEGLASTEKVRITVYRLIGESPEAFQMRVEQERVVAHWRANQMQYVPCVRPPEPGLGNVYGGSPYWRD